MISRCARAWLLTLVSVLMAACQNAPTRAVETEPRFSPADSAAVAGPAVLPLAPVGPIKLTPETVVVDARKPFEFASSRIPRSVSMQWSDFTQPQARGVLQADLFEAARRLARAGIGPETPVVVVGSGRKGGGEEGRIAWMLRYLGVERVRFAGIQHFPGPFTSRNPFPSEGLPGDAPPSPGPAEPRPKNAPVWKPNLKPEWIAARSEIADAIDSVNRKVGRHVLLDVSTEGPLGDNAGIPSVWIPWTDFINDKGVSDCGVVKKLARAGVVREKRIIAFDAFGIASGAVAVALRECGYRDVANYPGGARDWESRAP